MNRNGYGCYLQNLKTALTNKCRHVRPVVNGVANVSSRRRRTHLRVDENLLKVEFAHVWRFPMRLWVVD